MGTFPDNISTTSESAGLVPASVLLEQALKTQQACSLNTLRVNRAGEPDTGTGIFNPRPWLPYGMYLDSVDDVCNVLRFWGEYTVADRLAYLASEEDLEDGESPATPVSGHAFLAFFSAVASEGKLDLACSPEGEISAVWRFNDDQRRACVWFHNGARVSFTATDADGNFIRINNGSEKDNPSVVMEKLVQAGLLKWYPNKTPTASFLPLKTYLDIVASAAWETTASHWKRHSYSETMSPSSPPTGWNTFTPQIGHFNLPASASP